MKTWIGSDFHFGHKNIMKFCPESRGKYTDVDDMNESMVEEWNALVDPDDTVLMVGDIAFLSPHQAAGYLTRLNGTKVLIIGNHDRHLLESHLFRDCFTAIHEYLEFKYNGVNLVLFHYPIAEWNKMYYGSVHFYGHLHDKLSGLEEYRARNVGMDSTGKILTLLDDAIADALTGKIKQH